MKAAVLHRLNSDLAIEETSIEPPGPGMVLLRTLACGICRTDLHITQGEAYNPPLPHVPGHEPAGEVIAFGEGVTSWRPGDRAVPYLLESVGTPERPALSVLGVTRSGAFAEYFTARADTLVALPEGLSPELAGLAACAGVTTLHAANRGAVAAGDRVAIIGAGGIGALLIQLLTARGASVTAVDRRADALDQARAEGASDAFSADDIPAGQDCKQDRVFDLVGTADSTRLAARLVRNAGRIVIVGEESDQVAVTTTEIAQRELEIVGSRNGTQQELLQVLDLMATRVLRPRIDSIIRLQDINAALARMRRGEANGRIVIRF